MSKVFFDVGISLDGYIAGPNIGPQNPIGDGGLTIHDWMFSQKSFREHLGMEGGEDNDAVLHKAKKNAGKKDVKISGGADVIQQYFML